MEGSQPSIPRPNTAPQLIFTSEGVESASPLVHQLVQPSSPHKPATAVAKVRPGAGSKRSPSKPQADRPKQPSAAGDSARGAAAKASDETRDSTKPTTPARPGREGKTPRSTKVEQLGTANRDAFGKGIFASRVPTPPGGRHQVDVGGIFPLRSRTTTPPNKWDVGMFGTASRSAPRALGGLGI